MKICLYIFYFVYCAGLQFRVPVLLFFFPFFLTLAHRLSTLLLTASCKNPHVSFVSIVSFFLVDMGVFNRCYLRNTLSQIVVNC